jgi:hypothetical protein
MTTTSSATITAAPVLNKPQASDDKPPVTTVFVGNISERAPDAMVRTMLQRCGNVLSWKRIQGASGKLQGSLIFFFSFLDLKFFATPFSIRLLRV